MVKLDVPAPKAQQYPTNVSKKEQTLVGNLWLTETVHVYGFLQDSVGLLYEYTVHIKPASKFFLSGINNLKAQTLCVANPLTLERRLFFP